MNCQFCRSQLPKEARVCPTCGNLTPTHDAAAYDATIPSDNLQLTDISKGPIADPYNSSSPSSNASPEMTNPYSSQSNPYNRISTSLLPPPPSQLSSPPIIPNRKKPVLAMSATLLIVILLGIGAITWPNWSSLFVHSTSTSLLTPPKAQSFYDQTAHGTPTLNDALTVPDNYGWDNYSQGGNTSCSFSSNAYHAKAAPGHFSPCYAKATNYSDFIFQAQVTMVSGHSGGIVFRADSTNDQGYRFRISTDGTYILDKFFLDSQGKPQRTILTSGQTSFIVTSANQPNLIAAIAQGTSIYLYVNNKYIDHASDSTYQSGQIGVYTDSDANEVDAMFRNAQVWKL